MEATEYWKLFMESGRPEVYIMYAQALKTEGSYVSENAGAGPTDQRLQ